MSDTEGLLYLTVLMYSFLAFSNCLSSSTRKHQNSGNTVAYLTEHVLYDVWHHHIRKPSFSFVHTKTINWRFLETRLWGPFLMPANTAYVWKES